MMRLRLRWPLATLALNPLLQSRDETNARFGGGQITGAWLGETGRQAVAIKPCIAPGPSACSNRVPHCRRRSCHVAARFLSLRIHIVVHIASLFASNAHLLLSQVQWMPVNNFCSADHLTSPQHCALPSVRPLPLQCMLLRHPDRARKIPVAGRSPLTGMTNRI